MEAWKESFHHCTEVRFASFLSGGFIIAIVVNPPERKPAKRPSHTVLKVKISGGFENFVVRVQSCTFSFFSKIQIF